MNEEMHKTNAEP